MLQSNFLWTVHHLLLQTEVQERGTDLSLEGAD